MKCPACERAIVNGDAICSIDGQIAHEDCADRHAANEAMKELSGGLSLDELKAALATKQ